MEQYQIRVLEMQQRLANKALREPEHRFGNLYDLLTWEPILEAAADRLLGNKGSRTPGLDGITRRMLRRNRAHHTALLRQHLKDGTFQPLPVRRVYIPKANGKQRPLGIPTLYDRWVQMAIKLVIEPIFESDFAAYSHGFRPSRSCQTAMSHIHRLTCQRARKVYWVIEGDIEGCFEHVQHKKLMTLLRKRIQDKQLLDLIWRMLRAGVMEDALFTKTTEGTPQGGALSPLLANIYLNHFDQWFAKRAMLGGQVGKRYRHRQAGGANFMLVRYADDFVVFSNGGRAQTEAFKTELKDWFAQELKLTLSEEKTRVTHYTDGFDFLGFTLRKRPSRASGKEVVVHYPSTASVQRAVHRIKKLTSRPTLLNSAEDQIKALNAFLRGWGEYFRHAAAQCQLSYLGNRAYKRMWKWLVQKSGAQHGWRKAKAKYGHDNTWKVGNHTLIKLGDMKVEYPFYKTIPHPYLGHEPVTEIRPTDPFRRVWSGSRLYGSDWTVARKKAMERTAGCCALCGMAGAEVHHIKAKRRGGSNKLSNLVPLCRSCHRQVEQRNSTASHLLGKKRPLRSGEPDALKGARPVRGGVL